MESHNKMHWPQNGRNGHNITYFKSTKLDVSSAGSQYQSQNTYVTETLLFLFQTNASFQMLPLCSSWPHCMLWPVNLIFISISFPSSVSYYKVSSMFLTHFQELRVFNHFKINLYITDSCFSCILKSIRMLFMHSDRFQKLKTAHTWAHALPSGFTVVLCSTL
jgi:hypothetical protein